MTLPFDLNNLHVTPFDPHVMSTCENLKKVLLPGNSPQFRIFGTNMKNTVTFDLVILLFCFFFCYKITKYFQRYVPETGVVHRVKTEQRQ